MKFREFPEDVDGDVLRSVQSNGSDMSQPMNIDFQIAAPNESAATAIAADAERLGYRISVSADEEQPSTSRGTWTVNCTTRTMATHEGVLAMQSELDALAKPHGGYSDGWGTFGNGDE